VDGRRKWLLDGWDGDVGPGKKEDPLIARCDIRSMLSSQFSWCCSVDFLSLFLVMGIGD
jgi:hypothetical protein